MGLITGLAAPKVLGRSLGLIEGHNEGLLVIDGPNTVCIDGKGEGIQLGPVDGSGLGSLVEG